MKTTTRLRRHLTISIAWLACGGISLAEDWPQFLGPNRSGISSETGLIAQWPADGPKEVWRVPGGVGQSGIAVSRGRLLTLLQNDGQQWVVALDAKTGKQIWQTP